jgi:hypothetical protein
VLLFNDYNKSIRKAKRHSWKVFCQDINNLIEATRVHKILAHNPINPLGTLEKPNGEYTATGKETLEVLFKAHFSGCFLSEDISSSSIHNWERPWLWASQDWKLARRIITVSNTKRAINKFGPYVIWTGRNLPSFTAERSRLSISYTL